ncbi:MAG TPA: hypothetical protein VM597_11975 [Gemmataceae bacterium]|nr:hypothetical protein [Gemmataceae bacterium]
MNLFDSEMSPDEAVRVLQDEVTIIPEIAAKAVGVVLEDRERLKALAALAAAVRGAQTRYFKDRTNEALQTSKDLERKLDAMLRP